MECACFLDDVFLSMEKSPFSVGRPDFWLVTSPFDWGLLLLTKFSNWNTLSFYLWLLKLRNLYAGLTKYIFAGWDFFKGCFLLVESNHWSRRGLGIVLCGTLRAIYSSCHSSLQTDSCTRTESDTRELSYLLLLPDAVSHLWCSCWKGKI